MANSENKKLVLWFLSRIPHRIGSGHDQFMRGWILVWGMRLTESLSLALRLENLSNAVDVGLVLVPSIIGKLQFSITGHSRAVSLWQVVNDQWEENILLLLALAPLQVFQSLIQELLEKLDIAVLRDP